VARKYHNLSGLVRDLEHAIEAGGTEEWDLLSRFDNALFAIEEADVESSDASPDAGMDDIPGGLPTSGDDAPRHDAGRLDLAVGRRSDGDYVAPELGARVAGGSGRKTTPSPVVGVSTPGGDMTDAELAEELQRRGLNSAGKARFCKDRRATR